MSAHAVPLTTATKQIVLVLQDLLRLERYASYADLKADLAARLARLRLPYDPASIAVALDQVERGGTQRVIHDETNTTATATVVEEPTPISREDASRIVAALLRGRPGLRSMPSAQIDTRTDEDYDAARERAYEMGVELSRDEFFR